LRRRSLIETAGGLKSREAGTWTARVAAAPMLPAGYVVSASRIADRRMILAGYRSADLLVQLLGKLVRG
jgi:hypothetical protein